MADLRKAIVSTHSRTKAAAEIIIDKNTKIVFQHTAARRRLPEAGTSSSSRPSVSTHSRTKAAAFFDTRHVVYHPLFQHTAARRRLRPASRCRLGSDSVSTHSRTKAAAHNIFNHLLFLKVSARRRLQNKRFVSKTRIMFQHTAARRRLP